MLKGKITATILGLISASIIVSSSYAQDDDINWRVGKPWFGQHHKDEGKGSPNVRKPRRTLQCDVAIIGGGAAGVHTAYQLVTAEPRTDIDPIEFQKEKVCLIERNDYFGGNIEDVPIPDDVVEQQGIPPGKISTKAYRVLDDQYTFRLAIELGLGDKIVKQRALATLKRYEYNGNELVGIDEEGVRVQKYVNSETIGDSLGTPKVAELTDQFINAFPNLAETIGSSPTDTFGVFAHANETKYVSLQHCTKADGTFRPPIVRPPETPAFTRYRFLDADLGGFNSFGRVDNSFMNAVYRAVAANDGTYSDPDATAQQARDYYSNIDLRFRADDDYFLKPSAYLEFLSSEWFSPYNIHYLDGGLKQVIDRMVEEFQSAGGQAFLNHEVAAIQKRGDQYFIFTNGRILRFQAKYVVIAADLTSLYKIKGRLVRRIRSAPEFRAIMGNPEDLGTERSGAAKVVTVNHIWDRNWWDGAEEQAKIAPPDINGRDFNDENEEDPPVLRADMITNELVKEENDDGDDPRRRDQTGSRVRKDKIKFCNNIIEIAPTPYHEDRRLTRSVYTDKLPCYNLYKETFERGGKDAVNALMMEGLAFMYPDVFGEEVPEEDKPKPVHTEVRIIPHGWTLLVAGFDSSPNDVINWSKRPLPDENIFLANHAYANGFGWSNSAYISSGTIVRDVFGLEVDNLVLPPDPMDPSSVEPIPNEIVLQGISCDGKGDFDFDGPGADLFPMPDFAR